LENAQNKAQDKTKEALRQAIEITKNKELQIQQNRLQNKNTNPLPQGTKDSGSKPPVNVPEIKIKPPPTPPPTPLPPLKRNNIIVPDSGKITISPGMTIDKNTNNTGTATDRTTIINPTTITDKPTASSGTISIFDRIINSLTTTGKR